MPTALQVSREFSLPAEAVSDTCAVLAKRGARETSPAAVMVEEVLKAALHVVVMDPVGVWRDLRASADGPGESLPIVSLGGDDGDVPLEVSVGELIADLVVDEGLSVALDLSHVRKGEQTPLMADVTERLSDNNRQLCATTMSLEQGRMRERGHQRRSAMAQTVRQMITDILLEGPATAKDLSARVHIPEKEVLPHLAHIRKSLRHGQQRLVMDPACCRACGFVFQKRERLRKPGRCPACHRSVIEAPVFRIQA